MTKMKKAKSVHHPALHIEQHYDDGTIGAVASVAAVGVAVGAALGVAAELPGLLIGAAIGGTMGAIGSIIVAEEVDHPDAITPLKKPA